MPNWNEWLSFEGNHFSFPHLKTLELYNCPELRRQLPSHLSSIEEIQIEGCARLLETPHTLHWLSSIKKIKIKEDLDSEGYAERSQSSLLVSDSPSLLQSLDTESCNTSLFIPKMIMSGSCLLHLELYGIPLTTFPKNGLPTSLQSLCIDSCGKLAFMPPEKWSKYTSLVSLILWSSCDALTSFQLDGFPALRILCICFCRSMDSIFISESPSRRSSSLQSLKIKSHDSIGLLKVKLRMDTLTALEQLTLDCPELSFCEGVCLPLKFSIVTEYLSQLRIQMGDDIVNTLMNRYFSRLRIGTVDDIVNTVMKESLLPISLVSLSIGHLSEIKSFEGNGLRHLSSLKNLHFVNCSELESLPEGCLPSSLKSLQFSSCVRLESLPDDSLPSSLKLLTIEFCPLLEERYKKKEHWSKISHIPVIIINNQVTI